MPTRLTIVGEVIKRTTHVSQTNLDRLLRESVQYALVRVSHPDAETNYGKEAIKRFAISAAV